MIDQVVDTRSSAYCILSPKTWIASPSEIMTKLEPKWKCRQTWGDVQSEFVVGAFTIEEVRAQCFRAFSVQCTVDAKNKSKSLLSLPWEENCPLFKVPTTSLVQCNILWCWEKHKIADMLPHHSAHTRPDNTGNWRDGNRVKISFFFYHDRCFWTSKTSEYLLHVQDTFCFLSSLTIRCVFMYCT